MFNRCPPLVVLFALFLTLLTGCNSLDYTEDHEQLSEEERIIIRFSHIVGENTPKGLAARKFAKIVKERSNGFVEVQVFPNGFLYKDGEEISALKKGDIQMIAPATSKMTNEVPEWQVMDLPFAFRDVEDVHTYLSGSIGRNLLAQFEPKGFYPLGVWDNGFKQITNESHPLIKTSDFKDLKFRVMPSPIIASQFEILGANVQSNSFNEVYQLLGNGRIDGQENTFSNIHSKNLQSLQSHLTVSNHGYLGYVVLMNNSFWNDLPKDIQILLHETMVEVSKWEIKIAEELNENNFQSLENCDCIAIHHLSVDQKKQWEDAFKPLYQQFENRFGSDYIKTLPKYEGE
ncbi:C4-dicarboxylate ABC transporter [Salipaludibacillus neizhouensis]|uniref:C4-dicarboxylate ABC transporter n=1 Tax=Salipaludibacillus neizhouensis TaxID=885475 RepID=A0A3A9KJE7_9BACI|nr:DctP family TRAP transporter solute-binding subunit [Salipaludibacillus neizhouensis]RKL65016.1 C4-dicarboxylate ABC transporter [Salipaludibacillus neizhouensis]